MGVFEKITASITARYIQPITISHFDKSAYGKVLRSYKGISEGKRCFLIGNGPSLRAEDLTRLHESGEITFAFNRIYNIYDNTLWRPTYYISQDEKMLSGCSEEVSTIGAYLKFIPIQLKWYHGIQVDHAIHFSLLPPTEENGKPLQFSDDISQVVYNSSTCMYTAAQLAVYMGIKEIYLIGVDHHFHISQNNHGEIIVDNSVKDYFSEKYNRDRENLYIPNTEKSTLTYVAMKEQCDARGVKVFNATRGGHLEVFQRVDFDSLFKD